MEAKAEEVVKITRGIVMITKKRTNK